jgi:hypothetical protein
MKTLKEMKAAMTASEMAHIVGGAEVDAVNLDMIDDDPANKHKTVSSDCPNSSGIQNCRTISGAFKWCMGQIADYGPGMYH